MTWIFVYLQHWQDNVSENLGYLKTSSACCCWNEANEKENTTFLSLYVDISFNIIFVCQILTFTFHTSEKSDHAKLLCFKYKNRNRKGKTNVLLLFSLQISLYELRKIITQFSGEWPLLFPGKCGCVWQPEYKAEAVPKIFYLESGQILYSGKYGSFDFINEAETLQIKMWNKLSTLSLRLNSCLVLWSYCHRIKICFVWYVDSQSSCKNPGHTIAKQSCSSCAVHSVIKGLNSTSWLFKWCFYN
jgi:hypothetical protein